jgi:antitoxin HigA-1
MARQTKKLKPVHPGEILDHEFMRPLGITAYRLAKETGITAQHIGRILKGTRGLSGDMALRLARYFGTSAQLWMNLQARYELECAKDAAGNAIAERVRPHRAA